jgi:hypothetical protein
MAKRVRKTTAQVVHMPPVESAAHAPIRSMVQVPETEIARRAFELYCLRGCEHGRDMDDWLQAERELREAATSTAA